VIPATLQLLRCNPLAQPHTPDQLTVSIDCSLRLQGREALLSTLDHPTSAPPACQIWPPHPFTPVCTFAAGYNLARGLDPTCPRRSWRAPLTPVRTTEAAAASTDGALLSGLLRFAPAHRCGCNHRPVGLPNPTYGLDRLIRTTPPGTEDDAITPSSPLSNRPVATLTALGLRSQASYLLLVLLANR
jgi:hypothetical protein